MIDAPPQVQPAPTMQPPPGFGGMGAMPPPQPALMPNPAFQQWMQTALAWAAEKQRRQQEFTAACELIRSDAVKRYKIDIEADSTVAADEQAEKQARTEFLQAVTPFMETMVPIAQANPAFAPLISELIMFGVRAFPSSRSLEDAFETALQKMVAMAGKGQPNQAQGGKNTKSPMEIQAESAEAAGKLQVQQQANAVKAQETQADIAVAQAKLAAQQDHDRAELALRGREIEGREALEHARMTHLAVRDSAGIR